MRESSPSSNQYDSDSTPGTPRRAPLPLPRVEMPAPAPVPDRPREAPRAPVVLFDRSAFETEVRAPAIPQPEQVQQEALKQQAEESEDDDTALHVPVNQTASQPVEAAPAPAPIQAAEAQPEPVAEAEPWPPAAPAQQSAGPVSPAPTPEASFDDIMRNADMSQEFVEATSDQKSPEAEADYPPPHATVEANPAPAAEAVEDTTEDLQDPYAAVQPQPQTNQRMAYSQAQPFGPNYQPAAFMNPNTAPPVPTPPSPPRGGGAGGGGGTTPPVGYGGGPGAPGGGPNPNIPTTQGGYIPNLNTARMPSPLDVVNDQLNHQAHQRGVRKGLMVGGVAGWFGGRYFAKKKFRKQEAAMRQEFADQLAARDALDAQNGQGQNLEIKDAITGRIAKAPEAPGAPAAERPQVEHTVGQPTSGGGSGEAASLGAKPLETAAAVSPETPAQPTPEEQQPDPFAHQKEQQPDHKVHAEWIDFDVDKYGHTVQREYGRAYQEEISQERTGSQQYTKDPGQHAGAAAGQGGQGAGVGAGLGSFAGGTSGSAAYGGQQQQQLSSGQVAPQYGLPDGQEYLPDEQHRLPPPKKQVVSNIANPLFWLMLGIIIAAFFVAALI